MIELLRTWWPVLLLVYVPSLVSTVIRVVFTRAIRRLDESHPDDLEQTAGAWLASELERQGLSGRVTTLVTDSDAKLSLDAYHPFQGVIQLSSDTHFKRDPLHWAIAAHELGHARFHTSWPRLGRLTCVTLFIKRVLISVAVALLIGNLAFALPHITDLAFWLFATSIVLHLVVLADELIASSYAMQSLRTSPIYSWSHMRSARRMLTLAFSTYLLGFLSRALLLTQWSIVERLTREPLVPPAATLTTLGFVLLAIVSTVLALAALARIIGPLRRTIARITGWRFPLPDVVSYPLAVAQTFTKPAVIALLLLAWNLRADPTFAYALMGALIPVQGFFVALLVLPMVIVDILVIERFAKKLVVDITHRTVEFLRDHEAGRPQRKSGNSAIEELLNKANTSPPVEYRFLAVLHFSYLPLLIALWLS